MDKFYFQHLDKAVKTDKRFKHVMAITLDPRTDYKEGVVRCITSREGDVRIKGYVDRSILSFVKSDSAGHFIIGEELKIKNQEEIITGLSDKDHDFIGLEDPDIWIDEKTDLLHLYFTIPMIGKKIDGKKIAKTLIHLGHAVGKDLNSLVMTDPVLISDKESLCAKELSIAPVNSKKVRLNLVESATSAGDTGYSIVRVAIAPDMGKSWQFGETVFHPAEHKISWIGGHASPGPMFPREFIDIGENKLLGIMNGREADKKIDGRIIYGIFSVGLFIYDYENGKIDWVSPEPFIRDSESKNITFASQFVLTVKGEGILYAHVDDSFVRAYDLKAEEIKKMLPI